LKAFPITNIWQVYTRPNSASDFFTLGTFFETQKAPRTKISAISLFICRKRVFILCHFEKKSNILRLFSIFFEISNLFNFKSLLCIYIISKFQLPTCSER
jgi:hypothetical protein